MATDRLEEGALLSGRYEILEIVGRGGMGTVYRARDSHLDILVAVKEMNDRHTTTEEREAAIHQFEREARTLAQLSHPNLPRVTDYFVEGRRCYLIMEFIVGETLDALLRRQAGFRVQGSEEKTAERRTPNAEHQAPTAPFPLLDVLNLAIQLADVLAFLHAQSPPIIFRDVKPANIMLTEDGTVKLIDFGIARRFQEGAAKDTLLYGSPGYSPPEQYGRAQTDPRSDLYAFGATLHHLLTGRDPAPTPFKFPPIRSFDPTLPPALEALIARCVEMDKERRIQSAAEARDVLTHIRAAVAAAEPRAARPGTGIRNDSPDSKPQTPTFNIRRLAAVFGLLLVAAVLVTFAFVARQRAAAPSAASNPNAGRPDGEVIRPAPTGTLRVESSPPDVTVYLDGQEAGVTPCTIEQIIPGKHLIRLVPPTGSGLAETQREVEIRPGETRVVDVHLAAAPSPSSAEDQTPSAALERIDVQPLLPPQVPQPGLRFSVSFRVTHAVGKPGMVGVAFYSADQGAPLKPSTADSPYQSAEGDFLVTAPFQADADPVDFPDFAVFVPEAAFSLPYHQIAYRVLIYVDGKVVAQSNIRPLTP